MDLPSGTLHDDAMTGLPSEFQSSVQLESRNTTTPSERRGMPSMFELGSIEDLDSLPDVSYADDHEEFVEFASIWAEERRKDYCFFEKTFKMHIYLCQKGSTNTTQPVNTTISCTVVFRGPKRVGELDVAMRLEAGKGSSGLEVCYSDGPSQMWIPAAKWMRQHFTDQPGQQSCLWEWWQFNGKKFDLKHLPLELQQEILKNMVDSSILMVFDYKNEDFDSPIGIEASPLYPDDDSQDPSSTDSPQIGFWPRDIMIYRGKPLETNISGFCGRKRGLPASNLLRVSKAIRKETFGVILRSTFKEFRTLEDLSLLVPRLRSLVTHFNPLRLLSLRFDNIDYFEFIGIQTMPNIGLLPHVAPDQCLLDDFLEIPGYQDIHLHFEKSPRSSYVDDIFQGMEPWQGSGPLGVYCHSTMVDWILTLAYDRLRKFRHVTFSGGINKFVREKWVDIFSRSRENPVDMTVDVARILSTPADSLPPICRCGKKQ